MDGQTQNPLQSGGAEISLNQALGSLLNPTQDETPAAPVQEQQPPEQAQEAKPAAEEAQPEQETTETETEETLPPLKAPSFWKKDARDIFEALPRHAQEAFLEQERERNAGVERQMREAAEKRKSAETELSATQNERQRIKAALDQLLPDLQRTLQGRWANVDWNKEAAENPANYVALRQQFESEMGQFQRAKAERAQIAKQESEAAEKARQDTARKEWESLTEKRPELKDQAKAKAFFESINAYALEAGYTPERFAQIIDHRDFLALEKAMLYDRAQAAKATAVVKTVPKVQTPGTAKSKADQAAEARAAQMKRLEQTGSIEDALSLLRR
jgi:colicin import membrane protein